MTERWLKCRVTDGMFSDENVVVITTSDGREMSFFVPRSEIKSDSVRVKLVQQDNCMLVVLPNEHQSIVSVKPDTVAA